MGSKRFDGVRFFAYSDDHLPLHVHGFYAEVEVLIDLLIAERAVRLSDRDNNPWPQNAKRSDVNHVRRVARKHFDELVTLWEAAQP
ncbi:MAG TPA: DUF4160 domain-containing protein [Acidobacteriaceae bacterium]